MSEDAALVTALAATAMPFATTSEEQADAWLRTLRMHGSVGDALRALGVGEKPMAIDCAAAAGLTGTPVPDGDVVALMVNTAERFVAARCGAEIGTEDVLFAAFEVYGTAMDRALCLRGSSRDELFEQLALNQLARADAR